MLFYGTLDSNIIVSWQNPKKISILFVFIQNSIAGGIYRIYRIYRICRICRICRLCRICRSCRIYWEYCKKAGEIVQGIKYNRSTEACDMRL